MNVSLASVFTEIDRLSREWSGVDEVLVELEGSLLRLALNGLEAEITAQLAAQREYTRALALAFDVPDFDKLHAHRQRVWELRDRIEGCDRAVRAKILEAHALAALIELKIEGRLVDGVYRFDLAGAIEAFAPACPHARCVYEPPCKGVCQDSLGYYDEEKSGNSCQEVCRA